MTEKKNAVQSETPRNNAEKKIIVKFTDNKRKILQNDVSANQRDQAYLNIARDNLHLKQNLVHQLTEATREANKAFGQISKKCWKFYRQWFSVACQGSWWFATK